MFSHLVLEFRNSYEILNLNLRIKNNNRKNNNKKNEEQDVQRDLNLCT